MRKVGRPLKYLDENTRIEVRRKQNRENQRNCRKRKKLIEEINFSLTDPTIRIIQYKNEIVKYFNSFDYDYFFTGTIDLKYNEKEHLKQINKEIKDLNQLLETNMSFEVERKIGIKSLRKYTDKYIQFLTEKNLLERCFVVFELGKNHKYHVHIMFKSNKNYRNFVNFTENRWLVGTSITIPIKNYLDKTNLVNYCVKELNCCSNKITDLNRVDNWFISGNFDKKITEEISTSSLIPV
ncbi:MAG: hypothetical protein AB7S72_14235 [Draconibacterium sp.]